VALSIDLSPRMGSQVTIIKADLLSGAQAAFALSPRARPVVDLPGVLVPPLA
jgi:hypothetical protein